ncbi:chromosome segregation protein SMC [Govanella unica]|uniref:Chromosome partition protein Smc n=1 Tax=Govanella unica TaxID=2975056 RepID=A0A9X3TX97_9PROT|nr:chromosome segregation protein SMC [Govania unica]MDA5193375.1 chromosome segregation protein SMC [Govania unica]
MHFTRLRLSGFKSFVDPTELLIEPGLTGVVGPNGCGKSNLLEAIRWVMGENSAKSMRGSGMDDVIFAGTSNRAARNLAEVTLHIDNSTREAPAAFNDEIFLEVTRRIERESGSAYRINGRDSRARDVQLLFADMSTGAHSPALVSQNRIGALISAKPKDRRALLEDAAGISGLHSRRDEAERRLKAAEDNMLRLNDVMQQLDTQIQSLRRQAKQATKYRELSKLIRQFEAILLYLDWKLAAARLVETEAGLEIAAAKVAEVTKSVEDLSMQRALLASALPALRQAEGERSAVMHRLAVARDGLIREEKSIAEAMTRLGAQRAQIEQDASREGSLLADAATATERLAEEREILIEQNDGQGDAQSDAAVAVEAAVRAAGAREAALDGIKNRLAAADAERNRLRQVMAAADGRLMRLRRDRETLEARLSDLAAAPDMTALEDEQMTIAALEAELEAYAEALEEARAAVEQAREAERAARDAADGRRTDLARLESERDALTRLLNAGASKGLAPITEHLRVRPGYEAALGAALGDDLEAPTDDDAPIRWRELPPYDATQSLPAGVTPLGDFVEAPPALSRRLAQTGLVAAEDGARLQIDLLPGQRLVSIEGALWRWDGFTAGADAPTAAALRLAQRNRLMEVAAACQTAGEAVDAAKELLEIAAGRTAEAVIAEKTITQTLRSGEANLGSARKHLTEVERRAAQAQAQHGALLESVGRLDLDINETAEERAIAEAASEELPPVDDLNEELQMVRGEVEDLRMRLAETRLAHDNIATQARIRTLRLQTIDSELNAWRARLASAEGQARALADRREAVERELATLSERPDEIRAEREELAVEIELAEEARIEAARQLSEAEARAAEAEKHYSAAQTMLLDVRETRTRIEASVEQIIERRRNAAHRIMEEFECTPSDVLAKVEVEDEPTEAGDSDSRLQDLKRERDRLGAVNLRADVELEEYETQLNAYVSERGDLESAIARLRQAIHSLNREGRERLLAAFEEVNAHFSSLFKTLFGGGEAYLTLTESDDPLDAGLEIMASPPGKRLQSLSLLSGGEQALTALSLIFAVFVTNPAPICVLDEVDAPLDDANVERFCNMLEEMVNRTATRFLVVTHNAVTMSRMNRLFGVTMGERGVSQLVSVDLERAERLVAAE